MRRQGLACACFKLLTCDVASSSSYIYRQMCLAYYRQAQDRVTSLPLLQNIEFKTNINFDILASRFREGRDILDHLKLLTQSFCHNSIIP